MSDRSSDLLAARSAPRDSARYLWHLAQRSGPKRLRLALVLPVLSGLLVLPSLWCLSFLIATILKPTLQATPPLMVLGCFVILLGLRIVLEYAGGTLAAQASAATRVALRHQLYGHLLQEGPSLTQGRETGALTSTLIERVEALDGYFSRYLPQRFVAMVVPFVLLICFAYLDPVIAGELLLLLFLLPVMFIVFGIAAHRASLKQFQSLDRMSGLFLDRLRQLTQLRIFGAVEREAITMAEAADEFRSLTMKVLRIAFLSSAALDLVVAGGIVLVALRVSHTLLEPSSALTLQTALFLLLATPEFFAPLRALSASYHDRASALAAVDPLRTLLENPQIRPHGRRSLPENVRALPIEFRAVDFTYPGRSAAVLHHFNLKVGTGEFVAIAGPSGIGKSTILGLLMGFIHIDEGSLALGDEQLDALDSEARSSLFSWVGQRTHIFYGTLAENIRMGRMDASDADVLAAAQQAGLSPLLETLPGGLETLVGERGFGLSGGEAQRVAIARAFLRGSPILLLDEPTTGLDHDTATALMETICELALDRMVILVSHDPVALRYAARVVTLEAADAAA